MYREVKSINKKRYVYLIVALLFIVMVYTAPNSQDYDLYLHEILGIDRLDYSKSGHSTHLLIFMIADTNISRKEDNKINKIRVLGIFNHFFVIENSLHPKSIDNIVR